MQAKDLDTKQILLYLSTRQGQWTSLGHPEFLKEDNVHYAFPPGTPRKLQLAKLNKMLKQGLIGGCGCGCRGDFEITDKGLELIGVSRYTEYTGY